MAIIAFLLSLAISINASTLSLTPEDSQLFFYGFFRGLQYDTNVESECAADIGKLDYDFSKISNDIYGLTHYDYHAFFNILKDLKEFTHTVDPLLQDCDLQHLMEAVNRILHGNYLTLMYNYYLYESYINNAFNNLHYCGTEYGWCGFYSGELFKYLLGFSLQDAKFIPALALKENYYEEFLQGILKGLHSYPNTDSQCISDFKSLSGNLNIIGKEIEDLISGKTGSFTKLISEVKSFEIPNMVEECNISGLVDQIELLAGPNGFITLWENYAKNKDLLSKDLKLIETCEKDYFSCGEAIGNAFQLLVGWSI